MKSCFARVPHLLLLLFFCVGAVDTYADRCVANDCAERRECFFDCNRLSVQFHGGISPIIWLQRGPFTEISCNASGGCTPTPGTVEGPVIDLFTLPSYHQLFKLPWTVGAKIGYAINDKMELYVEANYRQAGHKDSLTENVNINLPLMLVNMLFTIVPLSQYQVVDLYLGARYYFDPCWCDRVVWFLGTQVGVVYHQKINYAFKISSSNPAFQCGPTFNSTAIQPSFTLFHRNAAIGAGVNLGVDVCLCDCLSFVLTSEIIATTGPRGSNTQSGTAIASCSTGGPTIFPALEPSNFIVRDIGTEMLFPITLGLRYSF